MLLWETGDSKQSERSGELFGHSDHCGENNLVWALVHTVTTWTEARTSSRSVRADEMRTVSADGERVGHTSEVLLRVVRITVMLPVDVESDERIQIHRYSFNFTRVVGISSGIM